MLACAATFSYAIDAAAIGVGSAKAPLALVLVAGINLFITYQILATRLVPALVLRWVLLWLCLLCAWLLCTAYGDQSVTEADVRLLVYSSSLIPITWLAATEHRVPLAGGIFAGVLFAVAVGFLRFVTLSGGEPAEHALGYWGIKYLPATRNGDVFYPLVGIAIGLHFLHASATPFRRAATALLLLPLVAAVILSSSRSAWLGLAMLLALDLLRTPGRSVWRVAITAGAVIAAFAFLFRQVPELATLLTGRADTLFSLDVSTSGSNVERLELLTAATHASLGTLLGAGVGSFGEIVGYTNVTGHALNHAENLLLTVSVEQGLLGFVIYAALSIALVRSALKGGLGGNVALVVFSHSLLNYELNSLFYWVMLAYALTRLSVHGAPAGTQRRRPPASSPGLHPLAG